MPEGPEVRCFADGLRQHLQGRTLSSLQFDNRSRYYGRLPSNYDILCQSLPALIKNIWSKGKKIIIQLENGVSLVSSLGMEGRWVPIPLNHSNAVLVCNDGTVAYYDDSRHQGEIEIIPDLQQLGERLAKIGPDLLSDNVSLVNWIATLRARTLQTKQICHVLMKQQYFSGIGNYVKAMVLYYTRIRPNAMISDLTDQHLASILQWATYILQQSYQAGGASLNSYFNFLGHSGTFQVVVYGRDAGPCGGRVLETTFSDDRTTHWVPTYQTIPSPWIGPPALCPQKLFQTKQHSREGYKIHELRSFCQDYSVSRSGNKDQLISRLETKLYTR